ncbi:hypothetical protein [Paracraurococcus lichenis]|uniref:Uncharacterized protein n=1 Tax=Paracraurococcus lichenis TaxID=3064888 RepID=A0ABT9E940_9PROT|nr:hypothetical protein [Paracraurococcus sp. LOR1-02]MDO9712619.1 hypothetical protein [Paracraurococcus sp. LOR1-02]
MPDIETGHYFLTMLAPVKVGAVEGEFGCSYRQRLQTVLSSLPNSEVTANSRGVAPGSPFARNTMTHLARFVIIDDQPYNGRENGDTLVSKLGGVDPLVHQPVDRLTMPYLLFAADFDVRQVPGRGGALVDHPDPLQDITHTLWNTMQAELRDVFSNCHGFEAVNSAEGFEAYVRLCRVETTMPFNDYYPYEPAELAGVLAKLRPDLPVPIGAIKTGAKLLAGLVGLWLVSILGAAFLPEGGVERFLGTVSRWGLLVVPLLLAGAAAWLYSLYRKIMTQGPKPLPRSAGLPEVLKALYVQQRFVDFAIANQGAEPAPLLAAFKAFLRDEKPAETAGPTQAPGLIRLPEYALPKGAKA